MAAAPETFSSTKTPATKSNSPAVGAALVDLSTTDAPAPLGQRGIYVGGAGDITCDMVNGETGIIFKNVPVGVFPICVTKIYKTGTGATLLVYLV
jgi:hypothetical protein